MVRSPKNDTYDYDVFISYSSIDADLVSDFVQQLDGSGIVHFLDEIEIGWGESIIDRVFSGIERSQFVIVFVSENSLDSPWVRKEINNAFHREIDEESVVLLPLLFCDHELFIEKYSFLKDKKFLRANDNSDIVGSLIKLLRGLPGTNFTFNHPRHYSGPIWIRALATSENRDTDHRMAIRWGPWYRECILVLNDREPTFLTHSKGDDGESIPIVVEVNQPAYLMIGQGRPNSARQLDINQFWVDGKSKIKRYVAKTFLWPKQGQ